MAPPSATELVISPHKASKLVSQNLPVKIQADHF